MLMQSYTASVKRKLLLSRCRLAHTVVLAVATVLLCEVAVSQVVISPVTVEFNGRQRVVSVAISLSDKAAPMRLQTDVLRWEQDLLGAAVTEPSDELVVTPPIVNLRPGTTQIFRVALRGGRPSPDELAYRLILEDVSEPTIKTNDSAGMNVEFRMRYDLPVLIAPLGDVINSLHWNPCPASTTLRAFPNREACIRLINTGNRRVKIQTLTVAGDGWQQALLLKDGENVLVGTEREWRIPLQPSQTGKVQSVQMQTARGETLHAKAGGV